MKRRLLVLIMSAIAFAALPLYADAYRVTVKLDPGEDAAAVARRLAATYRGELERPVEVAGGTFSMSIAMGPRQAELLARDPHVETVQSAAAVSLPAPRQPEALAVQSWSSGDYRYDGSGNIRRIGTDVYVYDGASRVVRADAGPTHRQQYAYDGFGNLHTVITDAPVNATDVSPYRARIAINPETNRAEYPGTESGQPNPIDPLTTQPYTMAAQYDGSGRVTSLIHKTDTFEYDALDMVKKAKVDGQWRAYVYNASNERIGTIGLSGQANGTDTGSDWTLRDTGGQVLRRLSRSSSGAWSWREDYIYRGSQLLAAEVTGLEKVRHFHLDHLGSPRLITGNGGVELPPEGAVPVSRPTYYAFGAQAGTATAGEKQFTGHERDSTSLDYMHARYYSPQMGRFLSVDPVIGKAAARKPQLWNRYAYVGNNPMKMVDPDGRLLQLGACKQDTSSQTCKAEFNLYLSTFGSQAGQAARYLKVGQGGFVSFSGISGGAFAGRFGMMGRATNYLVSNSANFAVASGRSSKTLANHGAYFDPLKVTTLFNGDTYPGGGTIGVDPSAFPTPLGTVSVSATEALVHEIGHAVGTLIPGIRDDFDTRLSNGFRTNEGYSMAFENRWRLNVLGVAQNDIRAFYTTPQDVSNDSHTPLFP